MESSKKNISYYKFLICTLLSLLIFLTFRINIIYHFSFSIFFSFVFILLIIWSVFFYKNKLLKIIFYNLLNIIILNLILTPLFNQLTFDVPSRQPNYKIIKEYKSDFFDGMFSGKHIISADEKGYRVVSFQKNNFINNNINYEKKETNTLRIFTIGASTTEGGSTDDKKTWSSLLAVSLSNLTNKKIEIINAGMAGLRSEHHYHTFKRIKKYDPDLVIFLVGINDWNYHIINSYKTYWFPWFEIKFNYEKSILFKFFKNISKQINKKLLSQKNKKNNNLNYLSAELDTEAYLSPQMNSLNKRKITKSFLTKKVSKDYEYWMNLIFKDCVQKKPICIFMDQPHAYQPDISSDLKNRLWMTPPNKEYTLTLENLINFSALYNNWLKKETKKNELNFCLLSDKFEPNTSNFVDDCHFTEKGSILVSKIITRYINLNLNFLLK